jgi:cation transport regulator ChaC
MTHATLELRAGEAALFGYGSLIAKASMERTLGRPYAGPFVPCAVEGWRRSWDIAMPNSVFHTDSDGGRVYPRHILYLNVKRSPGSLLNGVLFVVTAGELAGFDRREWIYDREEITGGLRGVTLSGGAAWIYVGKPQHVMSGVESWRDGAIRASYLELLESGIAAMEPGFRERYERSSDPVERSLVIQDRRDA